jgi:hypothetical protein
MAVIPVPIARDETGPSVNATQAAAIFAYLACAAAESPTAINVPKLLRADGDAEELFAGGPIVEIGRAATGYSRQAGVAVRVASAVPGSYGDVDVDDFAGSAIPTVDTGYVPWNDHELRIEFATGGSLGTPGIYYLVSLDGQKTNGLARSYLSGRKPLGTSDTVTVAEAHARIMLHPHGAQLTVLIALITELLTDRAAHYTTGSTVHLAADTISDDNFPAPPTTAAECISAMNIIRAGDLLHAANMSAHTNSDIARYAACPPPTGSVSEAIILGNFLKIAANGHNNAIVNAGALATHGTADAAHNIAAITPDQATVLAGDVIRVPLRAPTFDAAGLTAAFTALSQFTTTTFLGVAIRGAIDSAMWTALTNGMALLREQLAPVSLVCEMRQQEEGETDLAYRTALETDMAGREHADIYRCANLIRHDPGTIQQLRYYSRRTELVPLVARLQAVDYGTSPGLVEKIARPLTAEPAIFGGPLAGALIREDGALVGHDERASPGLREAGFGVLTSYKETRPDIEVYVYRPNTAAPAGNTAPHISQRRIANVIEYVIGTEAIKIVETQPLHEPGRLTIRGDVAERIDGRVNDVLRSTLGSRADAIFAIDRNAIIDLQETVLPWVATVIIGGYVFQLPGTIRINQGK